MRVLRSLVLLVALAAGFGGCVQPPVELDSHTASGPVWRAALLPAADSGIYGDAVVQQVGERQWSRVTISVRGSHDGAIHVWHIHQGSCGEDGPVVGTIAGYTPIPVGGAGESQLIAEMPIVLVPGQTYFVHVFQPASYAASGEMRIAACGTLLPSDR
jgi:hypothetical protein